ncbi:MAG: hypothetical protein IJ537_05535 [Bacteroidaceae bacterium]|nr:hypothetical protein [Bacteroidaceae bacterium]
MEYIKPIIKISEAEATQMLAESLAISDSTVDGSQALTKENNDWNIWDEE